MRRGGYKSERVVREGPLSKKANLTKKLKEGAKSTSCLVQTNFRRSWALNSCDPEY